MFAAALLGLIFAGVSTYDFASHLDRQVHALHCSWIPGLGAADATGTSGCHVALMSPYSSVFRSALWGGVPISLPAMGVFAFLAFWSLALLLGKRSTDRRAALVLLAVAALPLGASLVMGTIAAVKLGTFCKLCIGIYLSSIAVFVAAFVHFRNTRVVVPVGAADETIPEGEFVPTMSAKSALLGGASSALFVAVPFIAYIGLLPDYASLIGDCGTLRQPNDPGGLFVALDSNASGVRAVEVLDPLCPSCKAFETRLEASGLAESLSRSAVLFPLDKTCNWMVGESVHPGACVVSEAVLCAGPRARDVLAWAFTEQETILAATRADAGAAARLVGERFPDLRSCIGTPNVRQKLNRSLRWAVANQLPILTPQFYVGGKKLCDEDTDLGMEYALSHLLEQAGGAR